MKLTGEYFIPNQSSKRIQDDHLSRYYFATKYVDNKIVLDCACGTGYGTKILSAKAKAVTALDISSEVIDYAKYHYAAKNITYSIKDINYLKGSSYYDIIVSFETIEHIKDYHRLLTNFYNLLKTGGLLIISSPNRKSLSLGKRSLTDKPQNKYHHQEFTINELKNILIDIGFKISDVFGQRQRPFFKNYLVNKIYNKIFNPDKNTSPNVSKIKLMPRYFIIICKK